MSITAESPTFVALGLISVECNIDPLKCPVRIVRQNPHLFGTQHMCQHPNAPKVEDESLTAGGFKYRTCVTKTVAEE